MIPAYGNTWEIGVLYGPHGAPDFFRPEAIEAFFAADWEVHYNSNRLGVRLTGPKPTWARENGGEAGLHPVSYTHLDVYKRQVPEVGKVHDAGLSRTRPGLPSRGYGTAR